MVTMNMRPRVAASLSTPPLSGDHASVSLTMPGGVTIVSQKWGSTTTNRTYGTGANPSDYAANVGGMLYGSAVGSDGNHYHASGAITTPAETGAAPSITGVPTIAGVADLGETLTATYAAITGDPAPTNTGQWFKDGFEIVGETGLNYSIPAVGDVGSITFVQTATNSNGVATAGSFPATAGRALTVSVKVTAPRSIMAPASFTLEAEIAETVPYVPASGAPLPPTTNTNFLLATHEWSVSQLETDKQLHTGGWEISPRLMMRSREYSQRVQHMYVQPGSHFWYVRAIFPDGRTGSASGTIIVEDMEAQYTAAETYVVSANGEWSGAPAHDLANRYTDLRAAWEFIRLNGIAGGKYRILIDPFQGLTYTAATWPLDLENKAMVANEIYIGSWVRGTEVEIRMEDVRSALFTMKPITAGGNPNFVLKFEDIAMVAYAHDSRSETGVVMPNWVQEELTTEIILNNCRSYGAGVLLDGTNNIPGHLIHVNDHLNEMMADFIGILPHAGGVLAITGCRNVSPPDNAVGGLGKIFRETNWHNFIRAGFKFGYFVKNNIYGNSSWTGVSYNSPFRLGRNNSPDMYAVIAANIVSGQASSQLDNDVGDMTLRHLYFGHNYCILSPLDNRALVTLAGNVMVENNIFLHHDTPDNSGSNKWSGRTPVAAGSYKARTDIGGTSGLNDPIFARNNTIIDFASQAPGETDGVSLQQILLDLDSNGGGFFTSLEEAGTLVHQPNAPSRLTQPLDDVILAFDSPCDALRINWAEVRNFELSSNILPGGTFEVPYTGNFLSAREGRQLDQAQFSDLTLTPERHDITKIDIEDNENVVIQVDTPNANETTVINNTGLPWAAGDTLRVRPYPAPYDGSGDQLIYRLPATVPDGGSVVVPQDDDYIADFGPFALRPSGHVRVNIDGVVGATATATGILVENIGENGWEVGRFSTITITLGNNPVRETSIAHPTGTIKWYRPTTAVLQGSPVPDYLRSPVDFEVQPKPGSVHPDAPAGNYCIGYLNAA